VVTHDARIEPFADRVIHLEDGCIVREEQKIVLTSIRSQTGSG
jgi:ABC-type lipoprotein export system ATPase subunit